MGLIAKMISSYMANRKYKDILRVEKAMSKALGKGFGGFSIEEEIEAISQFCTPSAVRTTVDIGGNNGSYTKSLLEKFPNSTVDVFEPAKTNIDILNEKFKDNLRVKIHPFAVSERAENTVLYSNKSGSGLASLTKRNLDHHNIDFNLREEIESIVFEDFWKDQMQSKPIDVLKLDIEGHELFALKGFGEAMQHVKLIQFEFGGCNIDTRTFFQDFWYFFKNHGFEIHRITPRGAMLIERYTEMDEIFTTTNFIAVKIK